MAFPQKGYSVSRTPSSRANPSPSLLLLLSPCRSYSYASTSPKRHSFSQKIFVIATVVSTSSSSAPSAGSPATVGTTGAFVKAATPSPPAPAHQDVRDASPHSPKTPRDSSYCIEIRLRHAIRLFEGRRPTYALPKRYLLGSTEP